MKWKDVKVEFCELPDLSGERVEDVEATTFAAPGSIEHITCEICLGGFRCR